MHLAFLKHQNTKTSLYKLSKEHWVIAFFKCFWFVRRELQFTVYLDHPVLCARKELVIDHFLYCRHSL